MNCRAPYILVTFGSASFRWGTRPSQNRVGNAITETAKPSEGGLSLLVQMTPQIEDRENVRVSQVRG